MHRTSAVEIGSTSDVKAATGGWLAGAVTVTLWLMVPVAPPLSVTTSSTV